MSNQTQSLEDIFNGVEEESVENQETEQSVQEAMQQTESESKSEETTAETEQEPEKAPEPEAPAASQEPESESWTKTAVLDERRKRQALEAKLAEYEKAQREPVQAPDVIDDQAGYTDFVSKQVDEKVQKVRIEMSQEFMRTQDPEYDQKEIEFLELATENPQLGAELFKHAMPAKFVVDTVNKARELKKLENVDEYKAQLRAEVEAKVREELKAEFEAEKQKDERVSSIKPSLAKSRSSKEQGEVMHETLEDLFDN